MGALCAAGCEAGTEEPEEGDVAAEDGAKLGGPHVMKTSQEEAAQASPDAERSVYPLTWFGGPVVQNVSIHPVYWNGGVAFQSKLNAFYSGISAGQYMAFLSQYSTPATANHPAQIIGNGSSAPGIVSTQSATSVTDAQIQAFLKSQFTAGKLSAPGKNTYYPIHFPAGVSITGADGSKSCQAFCAYHSTFAYNGTYVYYGVIPDMGSGGCQAGCGSSSPFNNTTAVASHEYAETITDPAVGLASNYAAPLAWYNKIGGEIGDICNAQVATVPLNNGVSYVVQKLWSNKAGACVAP
jgi:hypothetical protein